MNSEALKILRKLTHVVTAINDAVIRFRENTWRIIIETKAGILLKIVSVLNKQHSLFININIPQNC